MTRYQGVINGVEVGGGHYNQFRRIPIPSEAAPVVTAALTYALRVYNDDDVEHTFNVSAYGFLVEIAT